jgi:superfamily II DNA/RNA helicase
MYDYKVYTKKIEEVRALKLTKETKEKLGMQLGMYGILRTVLLKRLESSSSALLSSVKKYQKRLKTFEDVLVQEKIILNLSDIDDILDEYEAEDGDSLDLTDADILKKAKELGTKISNDTHNIQAITEDIALERKILDIIILLTSSLKQNDRKLDQFIETINVLTKNETRKKILVFSFFADTVEYLKEKLLDQPNTVFTTINTAFVSGRNRVVALSSAERFAPVAKDARERILPDQELTYLFSTDVLAEGQNLQDCGLLINYDLHWNPVRMIQRNGRINRLGSPYDQIEVVNMVPGKELDQFLGLVSKLQDKISLINATIGSDSSVLGEQINPINYKGIYDADSDKATKEYLRLEKEADVFTDDLFVSDLKYFEEHATAEQKQALEKIPLRKWGVLDQSKITAPEVIVFAEAEFSNDQKQYTFFRNNRNANAIDVLLSGEALSHLKSDNIERSKDKISIDKLHHMDYVAEMGPQITRFDPAERRPTQSQQTVLDEAFAVGWSAEDRVRLEQLLLTRNVFHGRIARKLTKELREVIRDGKISERDTILDKIRVMLPPEKESVRIKEINPLFGFSRDNK